MRVDDSQRHAILCAVQKILSVQFPGQKIDAPRKFGMQAYHPAEALDYLTAQVESLA